MKTKRARSFGALIGWFIRDDESERRSHSCFVFVQRRYYKLVLRVLYTTRKYERVCVIIVSIYDVYIIHVRYVPCVACDLICVYNIVFSYRELLIRHSYHN